MLNKNNYYGNDDFPDLNKKKKMWNNIEAGIKPKRKFIFRIKDLPSFYYGVAASFIFFFTSIGVYTTAKQFIYNSKPEEVKLNSAYQSAIREFEKVVPTAISTMPQATNVKEYIASKKEQLNYIESAIEEMKNDTHGGSLTQLKQIRLRQLYYAKLKVLQEIIDKGEIEL